MPRWTQMELLTELEPVVGRELDRHLRSAREWFPARVRAVERGPQLRRRAGRRRVGSTQSRVPEVARTALIVNLLTEDNLPSYHREIATSFGTRRRLGHLGRTAGPPRRAGTGSRSATTC